MGGIYRDPNRNAFLDDLIIAQDTLDSATGLYIGDLTTHGSNNIYFGINAVDSPQIGVTVQSVPQTFAHTDLTSSGSSQIMSIKSGNGSEIQMAPESMNIKLPSRVTAAGAPALPWQVINKIKANCVISRETGPTYVRIEGVPQLQDSETDPSITYGNAILEFADKTQSEDHNRARIWWDGGNEKLNIK